MNPHDPHLAPDAALLAPTHPHTDDEALDGFMKLARLEGIIPALESAHAIAEVIKVAPTMSKDDLIIVNLSGRGDKDVAQVADKVTLD